MPAKTHSLRALPTTDDSVASAPRTVTLAAAPIDAPPSFLEKPEPAADEPIAHGERSNLQLYLQEISKTPLLTIN